MEETSLQPGEIRDIQTEEDVNEVVDSRRKTQEKKENERKKKCRIENKRGEKNLDGDVLRQTKLIEAIAPLTIVYGEMILLLGVRN
ncbi:Hypothetical predicted protein [Octopus vulgaris]|uniref:Uncharacterized protein n=1 Tax=Octopus vulgaris TaxID=6645 RepID=A0AA36FLC7_OCTVU|nr:Hypothetical predicted protein [Octopus vulgaris]